ncbi:hypothetical protein Lal_00016882 [Lupinus albus]|nr:hypothetical protein Lal_00016882 [Lupinus albus]
MGNVASNFNALIKVGEKLEGGLRSGKIVEGNTISGKKPNFLKKKEGETNFVTTEHKKNTQNTYRAPSRFTQTQTHNPNTYPQNQNTNATTNTYIPPNSNTMQYPPQYNNNHHPRQNHFTQNLNEKKTPQFDPIPVTYAEIFDPDYRKVPESPRPWFNPNVTCAYHSGVIGHSIEHCRALKYKVQHLVDTKQLTFEDAPPDVHKNPLPNHGNQGINAVEGEQRGSYIWEVPEIKTPIKVIFHEMCKHGMVEKLMEDEDPNSCEWHGPIGHTLEDCSEFRLSLQKMLDMRLIIVESGPSGQSVNAITQGEGDTSQTPRPSMTRFCPIMNVPHNALSHSSRWVPVMKPSQPFPYKSDKAVPWVYGGSSVEIVREPLEVTNVAGVSRITRSGRVYGPLDAEKVPTNTGKRKANVNTPANEEVETDLGEAIMPEDKGGVSSEEACEFLKFIRQSEYKVVDQLSRTPTRISILALLMSSEAHRNVLLKEDMLISRPSGMPYIEAAEEALEISVQGLEFANASFERERISEQRPQPSGASLMMAKVMLNKGYHPGTGLGKFGQEIESILIPQGTKGRHGLGYEPTQKDWEKAAEEKRKGRMARLGQFEYKAGGILIPHICQSFISAGFASGTIAVVGGVGLGN